MFDTYITVVGNVMTLPEWRRTSNTQTPVASFKVASTARRYDREKEQWVDGNSLRVRVTCWRRLAEGVASSLAIGDPVMVSGRMYTRDWEDGDGNHRTMYELEAVAVGHDLARGQGKFTRNPRSSTSEIVDAAEPDDELPPAVPAVEAESVSDSGDQPLEERYEVPASVPSAVDEELEEVVGTSGSRRRARTRVPV